MKGSTLKIDGARFVLTLDGDRRIVEHGSILVRDGRIERIDKATAMQGTTADRVIQARDMVVTPGFCNNHMHISYAHAVRGIFPDNLDPTVYLGHVFALQQAMTEEDEYYTSLLGITELVKYGTTCFVDPGSTKFLDVCLQAYDKAGCRIIVGDSVVDRPNPLRLPVSSTSEAIRRIETTIEKYDGRLDGHVRAWAMPFDAAYCSDELLRQAKRIADQRGVGLTLHQANRPGSIAFYRETYNTRPVLYLDRLGILGPNVLLAHVVDVDDAEIDAMAHTNTKTVMCPPASLKMGSRTVHTARFPEMVAKGICVSLGTDAGNNSNLLDPLRSVYLTAVLYKDSRGTTDVVPAEMALEAGTREGPRALGLDRELGSLEVGKRADLVLFDTRRPEWRSLFNPVNALVYAADGRSVHTVIIDGRVVVDNHRATFVDEGELIDKVQSLGEGLLARTGIKFNPRWPVV